MKEEVSTNGNSGDDRREEYQSFAEARRSYIKMLAKLLAIEILIEEGIIDEDNRHLLEQ